MSKTQIAQRSTFALLSTPYKYHSLKLATSFKSLLDLLSLACNECDRETAVEKQLPSVGFLPDFLQSVSDLQSQSFSIKAHLKRLTIEADV